MDGLGGLGVGLLQSSGYSARPISMGEAMGNAMPRYNAQYRRGLLEAEDDNEQTAIGGLLGNQDLNNHDKLLEIGRIMRSPQMMMAGLQDINIGDRKMLRAADGRYRYADDGELVFGDIKPKTEDTASIRELEYLKGLSEDDRQLYFKNKRGGFTLGGVRYDNQGGTVVDPATIAQNKATVDATVEAEKIRAKDKAQAEVSLPQDRLKAEMMSSKIDALVNHPGMSDVVGVQSMGSYLGVPGTDAQGFKAMLDQVQGGVFLEAFQSLKGGGTITEVEGQKAEQSLARLQTAQSEKDFIQAAEEFKAEINHLLTLKKERAGQSPVNNSEARKTQSGVSWSVE